MTCGSRSVRNFVLLSSILATALVGGACDSKKQEGPDPVMLQKLSAANDQIQKTQGDLQICQKELGEAKAAAAKSDAVVIRIEGNTIQLSDPGKGGPNEQFGGSPADDAKLYQAFLGQMAQNTHAFQLCYANALKKNPSIQASIIKLTMAVTVAQTGKVGTVTLNPRVSQEFEECVGIIVTKFKLPPSKGNGARFEYPMTLKPEQ